MESEAVSESNGPTPQDAGKMVTWEELRQAVSKTWDEALKEVKEGSRKIDQRVASIKLDARRLRLAMEEDGPVDTKTSERTEGAAKEVQVMHGDSFSANRIYPDPKSSASFGDDFTGPPAPPCSRDNALIDNGAAAPKLCLSPFWRCAHQ